MESQQEPFCFPITDAVRHQHLRNISLVLFLSVTPENVTTDVSKLCMRGKRKKQPNIKGSLPGPHVYLGLECGWRWWWGVLQTRGPQWVWNGLNGRREESQGPEPGGPDTLQPASLGVRERQAWLDLGPQLSTSGRMGEPGEEGSCIDLASSHVPSAVWRAFATWSRFIPTSLWATSVPTSQTKRSPESGSQRSTQLCGGLEPSRFDISPSSRQGRTSPYARRGHSSAVRVAFAQRCWPSCRPEESCS